MTGAKETRDAIMVIGLIAVGALILSIVAMATAGRRAAP